MLSDDVTTTPSGFPPAEEAVLIIIVGELKQSKLAVESQKVISSDC